MTTIRVIVLTSDIITERGCNNTSFISSTNLIITVGKSNTWGKILSILPKPYSFPGMFIMLEEKIKTVEDLKQLFTGQVNTIWCIKLVECPEVTQTANINKKFEFPGSTLTFLSCHSCFAYPFFLCNEGLLPSSYLWFKVCQVFWSNYWLVHNLNYPSFVLCFRKVISGERSVQIMIETSKYWNYPLITALQ